MLEHIGDRLLPWGYWVSLDVFGIDRRLEDRGRPAVALEAFLWADTECGGEVERVEERLLGVDVLLARRGERVVIGVVTDLIAALCPHVDGVGPREREWPVAELRDDGHFADGRWTDAGACGHQHACCFPHTTGQ